MAKLFCLNWPVLIAALQFIFNNATYIIYMNFFKLTELDLEGMLIFCNIQFPVKALILSWLGYILC
jgi:hypothetical protein